MAIVTFAIVDWMQLLSLGALVGAGGQGSRVIVGMKKLSDAASSMTAAGTPTKTSDLIVTSQLMVSLAIGAIAGAIAAATTMLPGDGVSGEQIAGLAAAGYTGADFIEAFVSRTAAAPGAPAGQEAVGMANNKAAVPAVDDGAVG
jgi:putative chitinase